MSETLSNDGALPSGSMVTRLLGIFHSPKKVFADVDRGAPWWEPWVWVSALNMLLVYLAAPIQVQLYRLRVGDMPDEQIEAAIAAAQSLPMKALGIASAPVAVLFVGVVFAAVSYIAVSVLSERASFRKHLTICLWGALVWWLGSLASTLIVRVRGVDAVRTARDAVAPFGPAALFPGAGAIAHAFLSTLDVFALWFYALVWVGVASVFRLSWRGAALVVAPVWLLYLLFELVSARVAGMP